MRRGRTFHVSFIVATIALSIAILAPQGCAPAGTANLFVAQEDGHVLVSNNGGENWKSHLMGADTYLWDVSTKDARTVWAVGRGYTEDEGVVFRSLNGGENWTKVYSGKKQYLTGISAADQQSVWAVGGEYSMDLELRQSVTGAIAVDPLIIKTDDGGTSWAVKTPKEPLLGEVQKISVSDPQSASIETSVEIWMTENGGKRWSNKFSREDFLPDNMAAFDKDNVWVVGHEGSGNYSRVFRTSNGGKTWSGHRFAKGIDRVGGSGESRDGVGGRLPGVSLQNNRRWHDLGPSELWDKKKSTCHFGGEFRKRLCRRGFRYHHHYH